MGNYFQVEIPVKSEEQKDMIVAQLDGFGFEGFEEAEEVLKAFIPENGTDEASIKAMVNHLGLPFTVSLIVQKNWNAEWEAGFQPVLIDDFCAIRASFHPPVPCVEHDLVITPKMSFGTGHHATTWLMVKAMRQVDFTRKTVIDFGTGTGILAILAEKLGAASIHAVDYDEWCIENSRENILQNSCNNVEVYQADSIASLARAHVILANINKNIILAHFRSIVEHLFDQGLVLFSGLLVDDFEEICQVAEELQLELVEKTEKNNWICLMFAGH